jgi:hypothetical protein
LGTRRLRLYVLAYLRGLLPPYYVQGNLSVIREEIILNALSIELDNDAAQQLQLVQSSLAQNVKDKAAYYQELHDKVLNYRHRLEFSSAHIQSEILDQHGNEIERLTNDPRLNRMIHDMKQMIESGEWAETDKRMAKRIEDRKNREKQKIKNPYLTDDPKNPKLQWKVGETEAEKAERKKKEYNKEHGILDD